MKLLKTIDLEGNRECTGVLAKKTVALLHLNFESDRTYHPAEKARSRLSDSSLMQKLMSYY